MIAIPYDSEFKPAPNIEEVMVPEVTYDEEKKEYNHSTEYQEPFIDAIIKREELIREKSDEVERLEAVHAKLKRRIDDLERTNRVFNNQQHVVEVELSKAADISMQHIARMSDLHRRMITLQEYNVMNEQMVKGLQEVNEILRKKSEEMGSNTEFRRAHALVIQMLKDAKDLAPRVVH